MPSPTYELVEGDLHRHDTLRHSHPHAGPHEHPHHSRRLHDDHAHSHGLVDESIKRSREGVQAVTIALGILAGTAAIQAFVLALTGSLALLADLIHNGGDALTAIPLGIAFALRSPRAERLAGLAVVAAIFLSACVAAYESILRLIHPSTPDHLLILALAGSIGFAGNWLAALVRTRAGHRLSSPALIADGNHARIDAYVSLAVVASAVAIAANAPVLDPLIGLGMTVVILRITRQSWRTVRGHSHH
jgi:cation diffusion facilitator family transporter